ncbi:MAG TPA: DNA polymerase III subunit delta' [Deltaproteobacteria bacterium]|nr:DNA polymerase III subunit delta' [Deltaproteobacteria bacterium]
MAFSDIFGHEKQIEALQKTLSQKRTAHAYLFSGIEAIGKRTLAIEFGKACNCANFDTLNDSCDNCATCRKIARAVHPDFFFVRPEGQFIRINAVREIQEQMNFKPLEAACRTFIVDNADKMNEQAANAILKTLEEPSLANLIILVTNRPYALPATIISRCLHMRFNPLRQESVAGFLMEHKGMEKQRALLLAGLSGGSIGRALDLNNEEVIAFRAATFELLTSTQKGKPFSMIDLASFLAQSKNDTRLGLDIIGSYFRDALVFKETKKTQMLLNQDKAGFIATAADRLSGKQILQNIERVGEAQEALERNLNKTLTLETMAFKLHY